MKRSTRLCLTTLEMRDVPSGSQLFAIGEDTGSGRVAVFRPAREYVVSNSTFGGPDFLAHEGTLLATLEPFPGFNGGVRVAAGDVTGDGVDDVVVAAGPGGGPHVKVYGGSQLLRGETAVVADFFAFDAAFRGGVFVAVGQMNPLTDASEINVGAGGGGGSHVRVFGLSWPQFGVTPGPRPEFHLPQVQSEFFAFDAAFRGGVRVAAADVTGDGRAEVITAAGPGGGPHVRVFDVNHPDPLALYAYSHRVIDEFFAYDAGFRGGVYVAAGQVTGDPTAEIVTGAGEGGGPHVKVFSRTTGGRMGVKDEAFVGSPALTTGVRVGLADLGFTSGGAPGGRPSYIYYSAGFDPAAAMLSPPLNQTRIGGLNYHFGPLQFTAVYLPPVLEGRTGGPFFVGV